MSDTRALFIPCSIDGLPKDSGSVRLRAIWPARNWPGSDVFNGTQLLSAFDVMIFQKAYLSSEVRAIIGGLARARDLGQDIMLAFDMTDPDWLDTTHEQRLMMVLPHFDLAVAPTQPLCDWLSKYLPAVVIPDRVDFADLPAVNHRDSGSSRPTVVWAGYHGNLEQSEEIAKAATRLGLGVKIYAQERPVPFYDFWKRVVEGADILLNPRPDRAPWSYKSDNKTVIAWALGMPVARTVEELERLRDPGARAKEVEIRQAEVRQNFDIKQSVREWQIAIDVCRSSRDVALSFQMAGQ